MEHLPSCRGPVRPDIAPQCTTSCPLLLLTAWVGTRFFTRLKPGNIPRVVAVIFSVLLVTQVAWNIISAARSFDPQLREFIYADMLDQREELGVSEERPPTIVILSDQHAFANTDDFLPYFFPGHRLIRNASELDSVDTTTGPALFYMDMAIWKMQSIHGPRTGGARIITYKHPHHHHRMAAWGVAGNEERVGNRLGYPESVVITGSPSR